MKAFKRLIWVYTIAVLLMSCTFNGTTVNYNSQLHNQGAKLVKDSRTNGQFLDTAVDISVTSFPSGTDLTNEMHTVKLTIESPFRINMTTLDEALKFYQVTGTDADTVAKEKKELPYTRKTVVETPASKSTTTDITLDVNFAGVTEGSAIFKIDATILKDIYGNFMLNENRNEKAGEAQDTYVRWANGSTNDTPVFYQAETSTPLSESCTSHLPDPCPFIWNVISGMYFDFPGMQSGYVQNTSDSKYTGAVYISFTEQKYGGDVVDWTKALNKIYSYEVLEPGATTWVEKPLTFKHEGSAPYTNLSNKYYAMTEPFTDEKAGAQVRFIRNYQKLEKADSPAYVEKLYGAPAVWGTSDTASKVQTPMYASVYGVYTKDPDYIIDTSYYNLTANNDVGSYFTNNVTLDDYSLRTKQRTILTASRESDYPVQYRIDAPMGYHFVASSINNDCFMITTRSNKKLEVTIQPVYEGETKNNTKAAAVRVTLTNNLYGRKSDYELRSLIKLWVGGVQITKGEDATLRTQKFGKYKKATDGDASGYVQLDLP